MKQLFNIIVMATLVALFTASAMAQKTLSVFGPNTPTRDSNVRIDSVDGAQNVNLGQITVKAEGGDCGLTNLSLRLQNIGFGSFPTTLRIFEGNTLISSVAVQPQQYFNTVSLEGQTVLQDTTKVFTLKGDFPTTTSGTAHAKFLGVRWLNSQGVDTTTGPVGGDLYGPTRHFFGNVADIQLASVPTASATNDQWGFTSFATSSFSFSITAIGANLSQPVNTDAVVVAKFLSTGETVVCPTVSVATIPGNSVADGSTASVTVTALLPASSVASSGIVRFSLQQFTWHSVATGAITQTWGLEDFVTPNPVNFLKDAAPAAPKKFPEIGSDLYQFIDYLKQVAHGAQGQVVGEGGSLVFVPSMPNSIARVVFPNNSPARGNTAQVEVIVSTNDIAPYIWAPTDLAKIAPVNYVEYPITNVQATISGGITTQKKFDVVLGTITLRGIATRTGESSCMVRFYWGTGSSHTSPGTEIDLLNLSPGDGENQPPRFKFKTTGANLNGASFNIDAEAIPGTFQVLGSSDLNTWTAVTCIYAHNPLLADSEGSTPFTITVGTADIASAGLNPAHSFFRLSLNP